MKRNFTIIILLIFGFMGCNIDTKPNEKELSDKEITIDNQYLIKEHQAGKFQIGKPIPFPQSSDNYVVRKEKQVRMTEEGPFEETTYVVSEKGIDLLNILPEYNFETGNYTENIGEIIVLSDKFRTAENIGVNSTIEEFQKAYPDYKLWYTYVSGMYVIETNQLKAQFILNKEDFIGNLNIQEEITTLKKSDFKKNSKVLKIRIL